MPKVDSLHATVADKPILNGSRHPAPDAGSRFSLGAALGGSGAPHRVRGDGLEGRVEAQKLTGISLEGSVG